MACPVLLSLVDNHGSRELSQFTACYTVNTWVESFFIIRNSILQNVYRNDLSACCYHDGRASNDFTIERLLP